MEVPMNTTRTHDIALLVQLTRDMRSTEQARHDALNAGDRMLALSLERTWTMNSDWRLDVVLGALKTGTAQDVLTFVCQHATDEQLVKLYCDRADDTRMVEMIRFMMA
jgi:hypothetical protein